MQYLNAIIASRDAKQKYYVHRTESVGTVFTFWRVESFGLIHASMKSKCPIVITLQIMLLRHAYTRYLMPRKIESRTNSRETKGKN